MKKFFSEFKEFISKGNVMSLAVGVIIGAAFQDVITSLTTNIISPILGLFAGQNFDVLQLEILGVTINYGAFFTSVINFIIMALVVFLMMKGVNKLMSLGKKPESESETKPAATKKCPYCTTEINVAATRCPACTSELTE